MLTAIIASLAALQPSTVPGQQLPDMSHMVREGVINPLRATHTVEWICSKGGKRSRITIVVDDIGKSPRNFRFRAELKELLVKGKRADSNVRYGVATALAKINNIALFQGRCRNATPILLVTGYSLDGVSYEKKEFKVSLGD